MSSPETPKPHNGNGAGIDASPLTITWRLFGNDNDAFARYKALSPEATKRLMEGGEPKPGEELYAPYLAEVGKMTALIPTQTIAKK